MGTEGRRCFPSRRPAVDRHCGSMFAVRRVARCIAVHKRKEMANLSELMFQAKIPQIRTKEEKGALTTYHALVFGGKNLCPGGDLVCKRSVRRAGNEIFSTAAGLDALYKNPGWKIT